MSIPRNEPVLALAGNPNTGKSTVFNALTGLRQHTGNWPGKTVTRAEGTFQRRGRRYRLVDLPGTYSLLSASTDEEIARDFILLGQPDCTIVVTDATCLERNLNLVYQVLEITPRVVVCVNLLDEARRRGFTIDLPALAQQLGVPVVGTAARRGVGLGQLIDTVAQVVQGQLHPLPHLPPTPAPLRPAVEELSQRLRRVMPGLTNPRWIAYRLLEGDHRLREALTTGELAQLCSGTQWDEQAQVEIKALLHTVDHLRRQVGEHFRDELVSAVYAQAHQVAQAVVQTQPAQERWDRRLDRVLTHPVWGWPTMLLALALVFWLTVAGANVPSRILSGLLMDPGGLGPWLPMSLLDVLHRGFDALGAPGWLSGCLLDGVYLCVAWVVSVMLPPMAIFFPLFTLLEDLGYLPRVAFNLDPLFQGCGAHGKQALTMCMGFGCNAAGVTACRIIDSPREKLIAILTNNFMICNGRFPTVIVIAALTASQLGLSAGLTSVVSAALVMGLVLLGVALMFASSWLLSRTVLRGEASTFTLEMPPYRRPAVLRILVSSLIDRTLLVLGRAIMVAAPAGLVIWLVAHVQIAGQPLAQSLTAALDPLGRFMGVGGGVVLLAYVIAIPANEIVVPTIMLLLVLLGGDRGLGLSADHMINADPQVMATFLRANGWTTATCVCFLLLVLIHNPCGTTIWTIWKETHSRRWTLLAALGPVVLGVATCALAAHALAWLS